MPTGEEMKSSKASYHWKIYNPAVGKVYESADRCTSPSEALGVARAYIVNRFKEGDIVPTKKGYQIKVISGEGIEVPGYEEWYTPPGMHEPSRPFPQTYSDWVDIAEDIKGKDPSSATRVDAAMYDIVEETMLADAQRRWLIEKAGELGIK